MVYINYGRRSDYELLINDTNYTSIVSNESFAGKMGLVRFGGMGRATKVKIAQEYGLVGLLMFSDPEQYAKNQSAVYPHGPWLPPSGVQRGSIKFASCPGNPSLGRMQALCGIDSMDEALPSIPVMPVCYAFCCVIFYGFCCVFIAVIRQRGAALRRHGRRRGGSARLARRDRRRVQGRL